LWLSGSCAPLPAGPGNFMHHPCLAVAETLAPSPLWEILRLSRFVVLAHVCLCLLRVSFSRQRLAMSHTAGLSASSLNLPFAVACGQAESLHLKARPRTFINPIVTHPYTLDSIAPDRRNMIATRKLHIYERQRFSHRFSSHSASAGLDA
jgi:hypothetical protein